MRTQRRNETPRCGAAARSDPARRVAAVATVAATLLLGAAVAPGPVRAEGEGISDGVVRIGLLEDMSGVYADVTGEGSVQAARMAIEDFGGKVLGKPIELVYADHQNKADIAASKAREWFDTQKVDIIGDVAGSATAQAAVDVARQKNRMIIVAGAGSSRLTNEGCTPVSFHYAYDTYALSSGTARGVTKNGGDTWFFLTADYSFGQALEADASAAVRSEGGKVLGAVRHPLAAADFSSFLLQAQASKAKIVGLANAGNDTVNAIKAANEFGLTKTQKLAGLLVYINDVHSIGLKSSQGMLLTEAFYWDLNDETRKWSRRYFEKMKKMPNMSQAGTYSSTLHYLKAVRAAGTDETGAVLAKFRSMPIDDMFVRNGRIREDGRMMRDMYVFEVKQPSESKYPWDYYKLRATIPAEKAYTPLAESRCPLVRKPSS